MRYFSAIAIAITGLAFTSASFANTTCQQKQLEIQQQIDYAQQYGNQNRVAGLKAALAESQQNCQDSQLQSQHQHKINEKQRKVEHRQEQLQEAEQRGDARKIAKARQKLREAEQELQEARTGDD